ncbi:putative signal transducing protein [Lysobacter sp. CA199]|uniref:putative signal transducing protein n=1 Tax=Lysobacter sp. CA199 TaxID=3455608 RepID=UPI003F8D01A1
MLIVYHAAHSADAQLVRGLLGQEGIQSFVFGGALEGGAGLLPVGGSVRVEVADQDAARAREIIEEWQASAVPLSDDEDEPADQDFGDDDTPEHVEDGNAYRPLNQRKLRHTGTGMGGIVFALLIGALLGAAATGIAMQPGAREESADYNGDGVADERLFFEGERLVRVQSDRNTDGDADLVTQYDARGLATGAEQDQDFNGSYETVETYRDGVWTGQSADYDGDGAPERQQIALRGVLTSEEWLDAQGRVIKRNLYTGGRLTGGEIDSDGDGALDTSRLYDSRGEIQSSRPLQAQ